MGDFLSTRLVSPAWGCDPNREKAQPLRLSLRGQGAWGCREAALGVRVPWDHPRLHWSLAKFSKWP